MKQSRGKAKQHMFAHTSVCANMLSSKSIYLHMSISKHMYMYVYKTNIYEYEYLYTHSLIHLYIYIWLSVVPYRTVLLKGLIDNNHQCIAMSPLINNHNTGCIN